MNKPLIDCQHVDKNYQLGNVVVHALKDITLQIHHGENVAIVGPSGSGKSSLMNILGCLDIPSEGHYFLDGKDVQQLSKNELAVIRNQKIGFIFQNFNLIAYANILENVMLPLVYRGTPYAQRKQQAMKILKQVGLEHRLNHTPNELSGGERQRVAIARALVTDPEILLADEPTGNLDSKTGEEIMRLFHAAIEKGKTLIMITHDTSVAKRATRVIHIQDGALKEKNQVSV